MELETVVNDLGTATQESCPICGSDDYIEEGGFYYCSLCNTQSQVSRLYVDEDFRQELQTRTQAAVLRGEKRKKKVVAKDTRRQLSTWEIWNVVLKNMADRLIEIGFPEVIRAKIFQIYVCFMMKRKVIFVSTSNPEAKSRITVGEPKTNLYALYGVKRPKFTKIGKRRRKNLLKKKVDTGKISNIGDEAYSRKTLKGLRTRTKTKAIEKEYLTQDKGIPGVDVHEFENLIQKETVGKKSIASGEGSSSQQKNPRQVYTKLTRKLLMTKTLTKKGIMAAQRYKNWVSKPNAAVRKYLTTAKILLFERFSVKTCLITVFIALRELGFPVVMTDILRLNIVGILRFDNVRDLISQFEEYKDIQNIPPLLFTSRYKNVQQCGEDIQNFVEYMGIKKFHYPRMKEIVPKYIDEFVLPREFECLINIINHMFTFDDYVNDFPKTMHVELFRAFPEVIVLVQFMVVLKMLFGLDDKTERYQSNFARLVNKVLKEEIKKRNGKMEEWSELFVIEDWFGYLQRRRELVRRELCCPSMYTPNKPPGIIKLNALMEKFTLNDNTVDEQTENEDDTMTERDKAAKSCKTLFQDILKGTLPKFERYENIPKLKPYIPLPLPTESIVHQYVERYPTVADSSVKPELLKVNFVQRRIDFIWNPKKYSKILKMHGYDLKIIHGDAVNNYPIEPSDGVDGSKIVYVFQPYKSFDEFIGHVRDDCSCSMKLLLEICEDIVPGMHPEKTHLRHCKPMFQKLVNGVGDIYIKRVLTELIPIMTRWNEYDFE